MGEYNILSRTESLICLPGTSVAYLSQKPTGIKNASGQTSSTCSSTPTLQVPLGTCEVPVNPSEEHPPNKAPALSVPSEAFSLSAHHTYRAFSIYVKVSPTQQLPVSRLREHPFSNYVKNRQFLTPPPFFTHLILNGLTPLLNELLIALAPSPQEIY